MENKKRELKHDHGGDGDLEDEMKMEKFYSLLRSFRDARDRRRRELQDLEKQENNKKMKITTNNIATAAEKPPKEAEDSFEWQDFTSEIHFRKPPLVFPNPIPCDTITDPKNGKKKKEKGKNMALDLQLSL